MQKTFSTLFGSAPYATDAAAKAARDLAYRQLKAAGIRSRRSVLRNQLKPWESFGVPCGKVCDVFVLDIDVDRADPSYFMIADTVREILD